MNWVLVITLVYLKTGITVTQVPMMDKNYCEYAAEVYVESLTGYKNEHKNKSNNIQFPGGRLHASAICLEAKGFTEGPNKTNK